MVVTSHNKQIFFFFLPTVLSNMNDFKTGLFDPLMRPEGFLPLNEWAKK